MIQDISFEFSGGTKTVTLQTRANDLPLRSEISKQCEWLKIAVEFDMVSIQAQPTYDYKERSAVIHVYNSFDNCVDIRVKQNGFSGIGIKCDSTIVLKDSYFDNYKYYNYYISIYGGNTQNVVCNALKNHITQVWDNSAMFNDYIIKIPRGLSGKYTLKHSEYTNYKKYCKEKHIQFDEEKVKREIEIIQLTNEDMIGTMMVTYNGTEYNTFDTIPINAKYGKDTIIDIVSTSYIKQVTPIKHIVVENSGVGIMESPSWLNIEIISNTIHITPKERNNLTTRYFKLKVYNQTNPNQFINLDLKQESGD